MRNKEEVKPSKNCFWSEFESINCWYISINNYSLIGNFIENVRKSVRGKILKVAYAILQSINLLGN